MKPFKLQVVLDYRKRLADQAQHEVAACMAHKNAVAAARKEAEKDRQRLCRELDSAKTSAVHLEEILLYEQCICAKQRQVDQLGERLAKAEAEVAEKQRKLVEARQKKKILEKLREKRSKSEQKKQSRQDAVMLDEAAMLGFGGGR